MAVQSAVQAGSCFWPLDGPPGRGYSRPDNCPERVLQPNQSRGWGAEEACGQLPL